MRPFIILILSLIETVAFGQFQLKGRLIAIDTKSPLAAASVFLSNTSVGTVTNTAGEFTLSVPAGKFDLVASFVGYQTNTHTISNKTDGLLLIEMQPKAKVFDEVIVGGYEKDGWNKWGKFFLENFIGMSQWAASCSIKNYKTIRFRNNKKENKLSAVAMEQLVIENKALGYTVSYQLEDFEYDFTNHYLIYLGYPLFTEMKGGEVKKSKWNKRRQKVYNGSMMQFMRALYRNRIEEEGYSVRRLVKRPNEEKLRVKEVYRKRALANGATAINSNKTADSSAYYDHILAQPDEFSTFSPYTVSGDSIAYKIDSVTAGFEFDNYLHVIYTKEAPPDSYRQLSPDNTQMRSELKMLNSQSLEVQSNGNYYPPLNLFSSGYWSWSEKIANMLPFDYNPALNKKQGNF